LIEFALTETVLETAGLSLRAAGPLDEPFLAKVYASTRAAEMARVPWSDEQRRAFLAMQHKAQHADYHGRYPGASFDLILLGAEAIGRLYVERCPTAHWVIDIALLPAFQGRGIGSRLLRWLLEGAEAADVPVRLHVEIGNPAAALYRRLGFTTRPAVEVFGFYRELEWWPPARRVDAR
jgi:ribosomal protein S18 acetylase RimI-like enzyme